MIPQEGLWASTYRENRETTKTLLMPVLACAVPAASRLLAQDGKPEVVIGPFVQFAKAPSDCVAPPVPHFETQNGRRFDLARLKRLFLFLGKATHERTLFIDHIHLQGNAAN